jgi:hypothetical protein
MRKCAKTWAKLKKCVSPSVLKVEEIYQKLRNKKKLPKKLGKYGKFWDCKGKCSKSL